MIRFWGYVISLLERQVENRRHITFLSFSFSLIQSIAQWSKLPNFFPLVWCVVKLPPLWVVCRRTALREAEGSRLDVGRYLRAANFRRHRTKKNDWTETIRDKREYEIFSTRNNNYNFIPFNNFRQLTGLFCYLIIHKTCHNWEFFGRTKSPFTAS